MTIVMILVDAVLWVSIIALGFGLFGIIKWKEPFSVLIAACGFGMALCITLIAEHDFSRLPPTIDFIVNLLNGWKEVGQ